jgi:hypothetical protein
LGLHPSRVRLQRIRQALQAAESASRPARGPLQRIRQALPAADRRRALRRPGQKTTARRRS